MPGRKDKKSGDRKKRSQGGGGADSMAAMFGFPMPTEDDADLEAELMALEGKAPKKGGKSSKSGKGGAFSMADVDSMLAGIGDIGEGGSGDDDSDIDDEDLLGELQALQDDDDDNEPAETAPEPPSRPHPSQLAPKPAPRKPPTSGGSSSTSPQKGASGGSGGGNVQVVGDRLELYKQALKQAEAAGEGAKARRYKRSIASLEQSLKSARAGKPVNVDDLPPIISIRATPSASQTPQPQTPPKSTATAAAMATKPRPEPVPVPRPRPPPQKQPEAKTGNLIDLSGPEFDEFNLTDEELEAMAAAMVDDRNSQPPPSQTPPKVAPPTKTTPTSQLLTRQPLSSVAARPDPSPAPVSAPAPKPKPHPPAQSKPPPTLPSGMIDLDAEEFDEFNLSDEDLAAMAAMLVDDRAKKPRLEEAEEEKEIPMDTSKAPPVVPSRPAPQNKPTSSISSTSSSSSIKPSTQSLPAKLTAPPQASDGDKGILKALLEERREQYLSASKAQKDAAKTKEYRVMAAQFGRVLKAFEQGQEVDLSQMPGPPPGYFSKHNVDVSKFKPRPPSSSSQATASSASVGGGGATGGQSSAAGGASAEDEDVVNPDIPIPKTPLEALQQRLAKYKEGQKSAQEKGESSRVRRMGRIIKQYEDAIKLTKAGKPCDYNELPTPPGYPPIPAAAGGARGAPVRQVKPGVAAVAAPTQSLPVGGPAKPKQLPSRIVPSLSQEQQALVEQRRGELLTAARQAQAKNDKAGAVHYMKLRKGLDTMLEAAKSGLPVNLEEIPPSPFADVTKTKPATAVLSHLKPASEGDASTFDLIEKQLEKQVKICDENAETYEKMGSTASSIQYQNMSQNCQRELLALKGIRLQGLAPPKFTMETRKFVIVHSHSEISSQVCEIEIISASNLPRPSGYEEKDMNVYVEVEFPWPSEEPPKMSTNQVKDTCSPEFTDQVFKFDIDRKKLKSMQRVFKRTPVKCVVWQKRTLRKDIFIGQGMLSLETVDKKCEHRATVDLVDEKGRRATGGKLTVEARLREPLTGRDEEEREEQWLIFHEAIAAKSSVTMPKPKVSPQKGAQGGSGINFAALSPVKVESMTSLEALRVEYSLVQSAVKAGHKDAATIQRGKQIHARMEAIKQRLQSDPQFRQGFAKQVAKEMHNEQLLETQLAKQGKAKQAEVVILQKRRAAMEKELKAMQGRKM